MKSRAAQDLFQKAKRVRAQKASEQRETQLALQKVQTKQWLAAHEKRLPLPPLSPKVLAFIKEWYFLVDTDGSGELDVDEVAAAMRTSGIPHTRQTVDELFNLVDIDGSGIMEWSEFETFVANEIQEGRDFMEGEFVLPSGAGIQFAAMVDVLRRKSRLQAVMKGGHAREATVAKMCEEVEAHAQYERTVALMRATGSRRMPKLWPSPSSPAGWALAAQQSIQPATLHKLMKKTSTAASLPKGADTNADSNQQHHRSQLQSALLLDNRAALEHVSHAARLGWGGIRQSAQVQTSDGVGRETQLLNAPYAELRSSTPCQQDVAVEEACPAKEDATDFGEAILVEEKYHRAGREVWGQRVDFGALDAAAAERAKHDRKAQQQRLGFKPLRLHKPGACHKDDATVRHAGSQAADQSNSMQHVQYAAAI